MTESINTEMINDLKELMEDDFSILIETFVSDADSRLQSLEAALAAKDNEQVRELAHAFKGSSANLGAAKLSEICFTMENLGRDCQLEQANSVLHEIEAEYKTVREYFTHLL